MKPKRPAGGLARPDEIAYYTAYAPAGTTVEKLVTVAGSRWAIESCHYQRRPGVTDFSNLISHQSVDSRKPSLTTLARGNSKLPLES